MNSSYDIRSAPGIRVPEGYGRHFESFDGQTRRLITEGAGGPTWYTEYNVLTGLSARSYGRMSFHVTRLAAGRVERGLPQALRRCGYKTFTLYPAYGAFLSARRFQKTAGIDRMIDAKEMGAGDVEPDAFYYNKAKALIGRERGNGAAVSVRLYRRQSLPVEHAIPSRPDAGLEAAQCRRRGGRIYPSPDA